MPRQGENCMPTYISLCRWTVQGATTIKESPARLDAAKEAFAKAGIKVLIDSVALHKAGVDTAEGVTHD